MTDLTKQIARIITSELNLHPSQAMPDNIESAAAKIAELVQPNFDIATAAASLEAETTGTLMDMLAVTIIATLIREEGGGRSNIRFSPMSMAFCMKYFDYTVEHEGLVRNVKLAIKPELKDEFFDSNDWPHNGLMTQDESTEGAAPQAEHKEHNRPVWAIRVPMEEADQSYLRECFGEDDAKRVLRGIVQSHPLAVIENRFCMHFGCPTTGCSHAEATSDVEAS